MCIPWLTNGLQGNADAADVSGAVHEAGAQRHTAGREQLREARLRSTLALEVPLEEELCAGAGSFECKRSTFDMCDSEDVLAAAVAPPHACRYNTPG